MQTMLLAPLRTALLTVVLLAGLPMATAAATEMTVYKTPTCGCCGAWVQHVKAHGFDVKVVEMADLTRIKQARGITRELASCHTTVVDGYVIEGHVPANDIKRLLATRPTVAGLAVPGMPMGSPGMEGPVSQRYDVVSFDGEGRIRVFSRH